MNNNLLNPHDDDWSPEKNRGYFGKGPKGWKRSDEEIRERACEALTNNWNVDASDIDVAVDEGLITLSGTVLTREEKREAEECVDNIAGVTDVHNLLRIQRIDTMPGERALNLS